MSLRFNHTDKSQDLLEAGISRSQHNFLCSLKRKQEKDFQKAVDEAKATTRLLIAKLERQSKIKI